MILWCALAAHATEAPPDRSAPPAVGMPVPLVHPEPEVHVLAPGRTVWHVRVPDSYEQIVDVVLDGGLIERFGAPTPSGQAMGWLADVAAGSYTPAAMSEATDLHGIALVSEISRHQGGVSLAVPLTELATGLALQKLVLSAPKFPARQITQYARDRRHGYHVSGPASPGRVANSALEYGWTSADHPYGTRPDLAGIFAVRRPMLVDAWSAWLSSTPATALVVGDAEWESLEAPLRDTLTGVGAPGDSAVPLDVPARTGTRVLAVDMPGQSQVSVLLRTAAPARDDPDRVAVQAAVWVLGGHFLSRLNTVIREERGLAYGAGARSAHGARRGAVVVQTNVDAGSVAEVVEVIEAQLLRIAEEGVTAEELQTASRAAIQDWNLALQTAQRASGLYRQVLRERTTVEALRQRLIAGASLTSEGTQESAASWLAPGSRRLWVFAGDRELLAAELDAAGLHPEWLTPGQAILGTF